MGGVPWFAAQVKRVAVPFLRIKRFGRLFLVVDYLIGNVPMSFQEGRHMCFERYRRDATRVASCRAAFEGFLGANLGE